MKRPKPRENDMDDAAAWTDPDHPAVEYARAMGKYANYLEAELATHKARAETERLCAKEALNQAEIEAARANTREKERDEEAVERKAVRWKIHADVIASERNDALARVRDAESERNEVKRSERLALDDARGFLPDEVSLTCAQEAVHILAGERDAARKEVELLKQTCEIGGSGAMLEKLQVERDAARVSRDHWRENSKADAAHRDSLADALRGVRHELWGGSEGVAPSQRIIDTALADAPEPKQSRGPISPEWCCDGCCHLGRETPAGPEQCYAPDDVLCPAKPRLPPKEDDRSKPPPGYTIEEHEDESSRCVGPRGWMFGLHRSQSEGDAISACWEHRDSIIASVVELMSESKPCENAAFADHAKTLRDIALRACERGEGWAHVDVGDLEEAAQLIEGRDVPKPCERCGLVEAAKKCLAASGFDHDDELDAALDAMLTGTPAKPKDG